MPLLQCQTKTETRFMANRAVEAALSSARLLLIGSYETKLELGFGRATGTYDSAIGGRADVRRLLARAPEQRRRRVR